MNNLRKYCRLLSSRTPLDDALALSRLSQAAGRLASLLVFCAFSLACALLLNGCTSGASAPSPPAPTVEFVSVIQQDVPIYSEWVATLDGYVNAQIQPRVAGYIIRQNYKEGSVVRKGEVLFEIDPRPFKAALDQAKAQLAQAEAQLGKAGLDVQRDTPLAQARAIAQSQLDTEIQAKLGAQAQVLAANANVEQELAKFKEQAKKLPQVHSELAAVRYYLHFALWECQQHWGYLHNGITNYATLLREIERWRHEFNEQICFVTFNYDTMLDDAMQQVLSFKIFSMNSYVSQPNYTLIKLHGSVNWGCEVGKIQGPFTYDHEHIIDEVARLQISDRYRLVTTHPMLIEEGQLVFPALAIPVEKKDEFACPAEHLRILKEALPSVTKILTLGWRAREAEFLNMLQSGVSGEVDMLIVSGNGKDALETYNNLSQSVKASGHTDAEHGFTGLINEGYLDGFLRR